MKNQNFTNILVVVLVLTLNVQSMEIIGSLSPSEITYARSVITNAQNQYLPSYEFTNMAAYISERLGGKLGGNYWDVFIFPKPCSYALIYALTTNNKFYQSLNQTPNSMCYLTWWPRYTAFMQKWIPPQDLSRQYWGSGINETQKASIVNQVRYAYMTKGDSIYENSKYLQLNLAPGTWEVTIASPTTTYGGFVGQPLYNQYAILGNYGSYKWIYILSRVN